jgi:hypothetical protein
LWVDLLKTESVYLLAQLLDSLSQQGEPLLPCCSVCHPKAVTKVTARAFPTTGTEPSAA